jgi:hypothetical protein
MVQGEPVVVTGRPQAPTPRASLVAWLAPDGAKRALCYLEPTGGVLAQTVRIDDPALCSAASGSMAATVPWSGRYAITGGHKRWVVESAEAAEVDLDDDGRTELVASLGFDSGAGCGSTHEWLEILEKDERPDAYRITDTPLGRLLEEHARGPIDGNPQRDSVFSFRLLRHAGKVYVMGGGRKSSAAVVSFHGGKPRTWCEYNLLPQHEVAVRYPIETWPRP